MNRLPSLLKPLNQHIRETRTQRLSRRSGSLQPLNAAYYEHFPANLSSVESQTAALDYKMRLKIHILPSFRFNFPFSSSLNYFRRFDQPHSFVAKVAFFRYHLDGSEISQPTLRTGLSTCCQYRMLDITIRHKVYGISIPFLEFGSNSLPPAYCSSESEA